MTPSSSPSVLIADNNRLFLSAIRDLYVEMGYEVRTARDGIEALELLEQKPPHLLLLDLIMPRIDGGRLCALVKSRHEYKDVRVIILSGILADEIHDPHTIGADAYVAKMPLDQIAAELRHVSAALMEGKAGPLPLVHGFEKMYRREVVLELLEERRTRRAILDSLSEGIMELSDDGRLLSVNRAFERIVGSPESSLLSRRLEEIFPGASAELAALLDASRDGASVAHTTLSHQGRELEIKLHRLGPDPSADEGDVQRALRRAAAAAPGISDGMDGVGYTLLVEDITRKAHAERDRERLRRRLAQSEKISAIGLLVSGLAHELNNPLTSVLGYSQLLQQRRADPELGPDLARIASGALRCKAIVENLMIFARSARPARAPVDLNELVMEALSVHRDRLQSLGAGLNLDLASDLPAIEADREQIVQAVEHVLDNAVKALAETGGARALHLRSMRHGEGARVEIRDSGPGIPPEAAGRIFEPFFTTRPVGQGTGLGLSASYGIVTAHGGRIQAANVPAGGVLVTMDLPGRPAEAAAPLTAGAAGSPRHILIVDDEVVVVELLADLLEGTNHRIDTATSGREGLRKLMANDYDLVVLDLRMPDMPGQVLYERLAADRPAMLNALMFITADTLTPEVRGFLDRTRRPWLQKPFAIESLLERARAILGA